MRDVFWLGDVKQPLMRVSGRTAPSAGSTQVLTNWTRIYLEYIFKKINLEYRIVGKFQGSVMTAGEKELCSPLTPYRTKRRTTW